MQNSRSLFVALLLCLLAVPATPTFAQFAIENAFPDLSFDIPVDLQHAGDGSNRLFAAELKAGRIIVFENDDQATQSEVFLDLSDEVRTNNGEEGLLGLAFDPAYASNGHFYVYYSASSPRRSVLERYTVSPPSSNTADPESGLVIMEVPQPYGNHNGGQIAFGPDDGFLYIALGDGGSGHDPEGNGQNLSTLLGSILRIDVSDASESEPYRIPPDNPFAGNSEGHREEIFAYGLRNPWRFSFDSETGEIWSADVGQDRREEINIITKGGNYGWDTMEASLCFEPMNNCNTDQLIMPVWEYGRSEGKSATGGFVYRGTRVPELIGKYIYADFGSGRIWALEYDGASPPTNTLLDESNLGITSFGVSEQDELYICTYGGDIYRFTATNTTGLTDESTLLGSFLRENYPNPVRSATVIPFELDVSAQAEITVYDLLGRELETLIDAQLPAGKHQVEWMPPAETGPGIYFYGLKVNGVLLQTRGLTKTE